MAENKIKSPIAGIVSLVEKKPGDSVAADDAVITVECMKMFIPIAASIAGSITRIEVKERDVITEDQLVFVIES